jgi:hypothetical protein
MCLYSATIRKFEVATLQARDDLLQLQDSLCMTSIGKLSMTLTPSYIFYIFSSRCAHSFMKKQP